VANTIPTQNLGFSKNGQVLYGLEIVPTNVSGIVYSRNDGNPTAANFNEAFSTTGSSYDAHSPNPDSRLDAGQAYANPPLDSDGKWTEDPVRWSPVSYTVDFVRSVSE
jgi:hypothetical protein